MKANRLFLLSIFVLAAAAMVSTAYGHSGNGKAYQVSGFTSANADQGVLLARGGSGHGGGGHGGGGRGRDHAEDGFHRSSGHHDGFDDNEFRSDDDFGFDDGGHHGGFDDSGHHGGRHR